MHFEGYLFSSHDAAVSLGAPPPSFPPRGMPPKRQAPCFHPSAEELSDFGLYIRRIEPQIRAAGHGGALVVPPASWIASLGDSRERLAGSSVIRPIRQHVYGREKSFQAVMEVCPPMSVESFRQHALKHCICQQGLSAEEVEVKFWRGIAAGPAALYGSDSSEVGSLFPRDVSAWNLSRLPGGVEQDLLQSLQDPIPGLNQSMLYFGMWRSFFAMHTEDCELQGASYLHFG